MSEYNAKKIKGSNHEWEIVIGLEVHAQIITNLNIPLFPHISTELTHCSKAFKKIL